MKINDSNQFGKIDLKDLQDFEESNQVSLPEDYKNFLIEHNGGVPEYNVISFGTNASDVQILFGMHNGPYYASLFQAIDVFQNRIPGWYIPIGRDSGGNLYIMSLWEGNKGVIAFWDHETEAPEGEADQYYDNLTEVASSFSDFINKLQPFT